MAPKKKIAPDFPAFPGHGVLTRDDDPSYSEGVVRADSTAEGLVVRHPRLASVTYPTDNLTIDQKTGRLSFISSAAPYGIRELREDDGEWLSKFKTYLPLTALHGLIGSDSGDEVADLSTDDLTAPDETLDAFATDGSPYIVGIVYTNTAGRWSREGGDWVLLGGDDDTFSSDNDDLSVISIDPERADDFLNMYDQNYVTVTDAERFEAPDSPQDSEYSSNEKSD